MNSPLSERAASLRSATKAKGISPLQNHTAQKAVEFAREPSVTPSGKIVEVVIPLRRKRTSTPATASAQSSQSTNGNDRDMVDEDDDAPPEAVSLKRGREVAEDDEQKLRDYDASQAAKRKEANRKRDQALKARAEAQGGRSHRTSKSAAEDGGAEEPGVENVEADQNVPSNDLENILREDDEDLDASRAAKRMRKAMAQAGDERGSDEDTRQGGAVDNNDDDDDMVRRMERAMREAEEEDQLDADEEEDAIEIKDGSGRDQPQETTRSIGEAAELEDGSMGLDAVQPEASSAPSRLPTHLPAHIFASAGALFAQAAADRKAPKSKKPKLDEDLKKKKRRRSAKEQIVGSTVVRVLASHTDPTGGKPANEARKFVDKRLALRKADGGGNGNGQGKKSVARGWERRDAHLVISQRTVGPASGFARSVRDV